MLHASAVLFTITIPTALEEQRLKEAYMQQFNEDATTTVTATTTTTVRSSSLSAGDAQSLQKPHQVFDSPQLDKNSSRSSASNVGSYKRRQLSDVVESAELTELPLDTAMEHVLQQILRKFHISNALWLRSREGNTFQISFTLEFDELYENLYEALQQWGIGDREGSSVCVMNCIASKSYKMNPQQIDNQPQGIPQADGHSNQNAQKQGAWNRFMNSVRSRLNVAQVVRDVRQDAAITFDFCVLLISAAILASFGLVENSTIFLASSMLISPLMGPIIAAIFGTVIEERSLRQLGMRNELVGILMATLVGFVFGLVVCTTDAKYGIGEGLTEEMLSRCDLHSLVVGFFTAIPSGAGAAIGILGGNIGSLVGVAISASLLPPAVNSGLLWALACIYKLFENDDSLYRDVIKSSKYSQNQGTELAILGSISMCLTLCNVLCIYLMGILVLKIKQIAPVIGRSNREFWKHDIKVSRGDAAIIDELLANLANEDNGQFLRHLDEAGYQHTWSPRSIRHSFSTQLPATCGVATIHRLEQLYSQSLAKPVQEQRLAERRHTIRSVDLQKGRPRFASMPSHQSRQQLHLPEAIITMPVPRFTVTPAADDVLHL
ncbi:uncharacterized protein LOC6562630 [Drosophila grimshawi]|uniref:GH10106 n=1 Tax=Drosophila grimshawi TaxID=7222 RepID=B4JCQ5_DROGR|nr:uncharacterized protein LOC6562630 [Drosophila grimshawi]EDW04219.1 GH10106 [Drosophila grimshawi]